MAQKSHKQSSKYRPYGRSLLYKAYEYAKNLVLNEFFVIGVLERLEDTLALFENLMPKVYEGASDVYRESERVAKAMKGSAAKVKGRHNENSRAGDSCQY